MNNIDLSIIIVNFNTKELLSCCIESIYNKTEGLSFEIIVVDNASKDGSVEKFSVDNRIKFIQNKENLGFGKANNVGAKVASGNYLLFLNPDTIITNNAPYILYNYLKDNSRAGIVGGNLYDSEWKPIHSFSRIFPSITREMDFVFKEFFTKIRYGKNRQFNTTNNPLVVAFITGADLMISKKVFQEVGGFDETFFMYYEDSDLCASVNKLGLSVVSVPSAKIIHLEGKSFDFSSIREERIFKGRKLYFNKHYSSFYNKVADLLNILTIRIAILICFIAGKIAQRKKYSTRLEIYKSLMK